MNPPPIDFDAGEVVCYAILNNGVRHTGNTKQIVAGILQGPMAALAICDADGAYYLFGCDAEWQTITDTWHETVDDAKAQAEFEYEGVTALWQGRAVL